MMKKSVWLTGLITMLVFSFAVGIPAGKHTSKKTSNRQISKVASIIPDSTAKLFYETVGLAKKGLGWETFQKAWSGFTKLNSKGFIKNQLLTIADMSQPSCQKRLYIIDVVAKKLVMNTLVAHGKNTGNVIASNFSNTPESLQSSLGFYITGGTYQGGNGYTMRLKGMEKGFNDKAESRAIVMHGAPYVSEEIARQTGRIGRSWGCPAVSLKEHQMIIDLVKNGSCLYVFAPQKQYLAHSSLSSFSANRL
jgi:hypothetical protein